jgi:RNAPII transcription regulator C-terminal
LSCKCYNFLDASEVGMIIQYFDDIILTFSLEAQPILKDRAIDGISDVSRTAPKLVSDIAIPTFLAQLPDSKEGTKSTYGALNCIAHLRFERDLSSTLLRRLLNKAKIVARLSATSQYLRALFATIYLVLDQRDLSGDANLQAYFDTIMELIRQITDTRHTELGMPRTPGPAITVMLGRLTAKVFGSMDTHTQESASRELFPLLGGLSTHTMVDTHVERSSESATQILSTYALAALKKDVSAASWF